MQLELRKDYLIDRWVAISPERGKRPLVFKEDVEVVEKERCPFCPGNEDKTPPALLIAKRDRDNILWFERDDKEWLVRCFKNLYPAFSTEAEAKFYGTVNVKPSYGYHEIIVETREHEGELWNMEPEAFFLALKASLLRANFFLSDSRIKYVHLFKNRGREAGASIRHPHLQIIALDLEPPSITEKASSLGKECKLCKILEKEKGKERYIMSTENIIALCPWASRVPYEILIAPKKHEKNFFSLKEEELGELSFMLCKLFKALNAIIGPFPFNFWFYSLYKGLEDFHWHLEIFPRLTYLAGMELGAGVYVNILAPEDACKNIKDKL
ncbi:MAG: DUF4921 family protein [Nitrososphaerales archaeon]